MGTSLLPQLVIQGRAGTVSRKSERKFEMAVLFQSEGMAIRRAWTEMMKSVTSKTMEEVHNR